MEDPLISKGLVEWLEGIFPDRVPASDATDQQVRVAMGRAEVVRFLRQKHDQQQEEGNDFEEL